MASPLIQGSYSPLIKQNTLQLNQLNKIATIRQRRKTGCDFHQKWKDAQIPTRKRFYTNMKPTVDLPYAFMAYYNANAPDPEEKMTEQLEGTSPIHTQHLIQI